MRWARRRGPSGCAGLPRSTLFPLPLCALVAGARPTGSFPVLPRDALACDEQSRTSSHAAGDPAGALCGTDCQAQATSPRHGGIGARSPPPAVLGPPAEDLGHGARQRGRQRPASRHDDPVEQLQRRRRHGRGRVQVPCRLWGHVAKSEGRGGGADERLARHKGLNTSSSAGRIPPCRLQQQRGGWQPRPPTSMQSSMPRLMYTGSRVRRSRKGSMWKYLRQRYERAGGWARAFGHGAGGCRAPRLTLMWARRRRRGSFPALPQTTSKHARELASCKTGSAASER